MMSGDWPNLKIWQSLSFPDYLLMLVSSNMCLPVSKKCGCGWSLCLFLMLVVAEDSAVHPKQQRTCGSIIFWLEAWRMLVCYYYYIRFWIFTSDWQRWRIDTLSWIGFSIRPSIRSSVHTNNKNKERDSFSDYWTFSGDRLFLGFTSSICACTCLTSWAILNLTQNGG